MDWGRGGRVKEGVICGLLKHEVVSGDGGDGTKVQETQPEIYLKSF